MEFPDTLGECIDMLAIRQEKRQDLQRELEAQIKSLKKEEDELETYILQKFSNAELEVAGGSLATATKSVSIVPTVKDWPAFYQHILDTGEFDLLQKRPTVVAYRERIDAGMVVPGVEPFKKVEIKLRRK